MFLNCFGLLQYIIITGIGVFFEILWNSSSENEKQNILTKLIKELK